MLYQKMDLKLNDSHLLNSIWNFGPKFIHDLIELLEGKLFEQNAGFIQKSNDSNCKLKMTYKQMLHMNFILNKSDGVCSEALYGSWFLCNLPAEVMLIFDGSTKDVATFNIGEFAECRWISKSKKYFMPNQSKSYKSLKRSKYRKQSRRSDEVSRGIMTGDFSAG